MEPVGTRHRSGSNAAAARVTLTRDTWSLVLSRIGFSAIAPCFRVCKQFAHLLALDVVLEGVAGTAEREHPFLPAGFLASRPEGVIAAFKRIYAPLLHEYYSLRRVALPMCESEAELFRSIEVVGVVPFSSQSDDDPVSTVGGESAMVSSEVAARLHVDGLLTWTNVCQLNLSAMTATGCISAFRLLPPNGQMLFLIKSWREGTRLVHDSEPDELDEVEFYTPEEELVPAFSLNAGAVRDRIFLKQDKWGWNSPEDQKLKAWHKQRQGKFFQDSALPFDDCIRIGGTKPFDTQGNFVLQDSERLLIQTSHPGGYMWAAVGFVISKDDLARGDYSKVTSDIVDDA